MSNEPKLNEEMNWTQVGALPTPSGGCVRDAFQLAFGDPTKEELPAGMSLYKFNGFSTLGPGDISDETKLSPWWSPTYAFKNDAGLEQRMAIAKLNGVSFQEWGRLTSAIKENWNSLKWLLTIELKVPVYGWFGGFKGMSRIDPGEKSLRDPDKEAKGGSANLPGGGTQFYIPHLTVAHIEKTYSIKPL
jgi:hypothetical protein